MRFGELGKAVPGLSDRLLSQRLRELEEEGVVEREVEAGHAGAGHLLADREGRRPAARRSRELQRVGAPLEEHGVALGERPQAGPELPGPVRGRPLRPQAAGGMRERRPGAADRRGDRGRAQQGPGLLRAARRRGRGPLRDLAQRPGEGRAARGGAARRRRSRDRRRPRLLPRRRPGLAELRLPRHPRAAGRRGRPAGPAGGAAQAAAGRGPVRAAEAAGAAAAAEDDRRRHGRGRRRPARPARRAASGAAGAGPSSGPSRRSRTAARRRRSRRRSRTWRRGPRSRRSSSPAAAAASPTSGPSATRPSAARWRCCGCRWSARSATSATRP